jgi:anaerobic magnesium-protoporphyrin IX monomethyl ester cyclase
MKSKTIILYFPEFSYLRTDGGGLHRMPYAILNLVNPLQQTGFNVKLFDARVDNPIILEPWIYSQPLFIGVSSLTGQQLRGAAKFARRIKEINPNIPIVWGGWHASLVPEELLQEPYVDIVCKGQFEHQIVNLANAITEGSESLKSVPGIAFKNGTDIVDTGPSTIFTKFSRIALESIDLNKYGPYVTYITSFGCPFECTFCCLQKISEKKFVFREIDHVIEDLTYIVGHKKLMSHLNIDDDNFFIKPKRVVEFCEKWIATQLNKFPISLLVHVKAALNYSDEMYKIMAKAQIHEILIGAESGNQTILDRLHKHQTPEQILRFVEKITKFGMVPDLSCMTGFPDSEELDDFKDTILMLQQAAKINPHMQFKLFFCRPYPKTKLFEQFKALGYKMPSNVKEWTDYTLRYNPPWVNRDLEEQVAYFLKMFLPQHGWSFTWDEFIDGWWKAREQDIIPRQGGM